MLQVAVDAKKRAFSWGWGGLGRLGHAEQKDELVPRLIKFFDTQSRGVRSVHCGSSYSLAINEHGNYHSILLIILFIILWHAKF